MKKVLTVVLTGLLIFIFAGAASAQYKATMKLASVTPPDHFYNVGARKFADLIKERTNGRIEIKVYPAGQLGKGEREITEAIQQGAVDLLITSTGPMGVVQGRSCFLIRFVPTFWGRDSLFLLDFL